jgi:hypothetical protein
MERADQGSPLPADPAGREDIMSGEQADREGIGLGGPEGRNARAAEEDAPLPADPAGREDVIRDTEQPGNPAAGG